jgi:lipopolysaccharide heptosyltransferase I
MNSDRLKILIVKLGSLGDIMHTIPAQQRIAQEVPGAEIHWLTEPPYEEFLRRISGLSRVWLADTKKWRKTIFSLPEVIHLIRSLRRQKFHIALDFQGLVKSALLARLSGAGRVVGFVPHQSREPASRHFYSETVLGDDGSQPHIIEINLQLARSLGCASNGASPLIPLDIPSEAFDYVEDQLSQRKIVKPILVNPGAGWVTKLWPLKDYAALLLRIQEELGCATLLTYGPGEEDMVKETRAILAPHPLEAFPTTLLQLAALCHRSRLLIAGDTGPLHLAVALGTPTVAILGPTSPWRNGPFNQEDQIVKRYLPCSNSYKRTCNEFICMDIPVKDVFDAVTRRLDL